MFRLTLPSTASMDYFPENVLSNFTVKLPRVFNLDDYECALEEIILPTQLNNVRKGLNKFRVTAPISATSPVEDERAVEYEVPPGYYQTVPQLIKAMETAGLNEATPPIKVTIKKEKVTVKVQPPVRVAFQGDLAAILGFPLHYNSTGETNGYTTPVTRKLVSQFPASPSDSLSTMYVYTDLIKDQYVGGTTAPLLRILNISHNDWRNQCISRTYVSPHFAPLKNSHFDTINVQIRDESGHQLHFRHGKVIVILSFRKVAI
jgi:hypothetical protein